MRLVTFTDYKLGVSKGEHPITINADSILFIKTDRYDENKTVIVFSEAFEITVNMTQKDTIFYLLNNSIV